MQEAQDGIRELLKPRYKVIADYPLNPNTVGGLLPRLGNKYYVGKIDKDHVWLPESPKHEHEMAISQYPHLFKKLEWWEERELEELPKYVINKSAIPKVIIPVTWVLEEDTHSFKYEKQLFAIYHGKYYPYGLLPATEQDYNDFINQQKR